MGIPIKAYMDLPARNRHWRARAGHLAMLVSLLSACAHVPPSRYAAILPLERLPEPEAREVVVVVNANSFAGSHVGLFAGGRLYDPSGTYAWRRAEDRAWPGPSLADYVKFHLRDGPDVRLYRFPLARAEFDRVLGRIDKAGWSLPMFCAEDVQDILAGVGPFRQLEPGNWTSPARLAARLEAIAPAILVNADCGGRNRPC